MLLGANKLLENHIVTLLARTGAVSADHIINHLRSKNERLTIQGLYRALRKLLAQGVLVKDRQDYSLRLPWILDLDMLASDMLTTYLNQNYIKSLLPSVGKTKTWIFSDITKLNLFWSQALLAMANASQDKIMYDYNPHAWFQLVSPHQENQFMRTIVRSIKKEYAMAGGRTYLDRWIAENAWNYKNLEYYLATPNKFACDRSTYPCTIGTLFLTVTLPTQLVEKVDALFSTVKSEKDIRVSDIIELVDSKMRCKIKIENNHKKTLTFKKKFAKIFGIKNIT